MFYLACAPSLFGPISAHLATHNLVDESSRVVLEKPIGHDLASACAINDAVGAVFEESQIFRIDHYLGKESVQNLLVTRFANTFLEPLWNSSWIDHVQITVSESLGVGTRGGYYDNSGALRDMVQNHLLQVLCLVAMEPPTYVDRETVRDEKLKVLQALKPMTPDDVERCTVAGQYVAGPGRRGRRRRLQGRRREPRQPHRDLRRGEGRGAQLALGRRAVLSAHRQAHGAALLGDRDRQFKPVPHPMFPDSDGSSEPNKLVIQLQPKEGMRLHMTAKEPGPGGIRLKPVSLDLNYTEAFQRPSPDAYERLLMDVVRGNPTLFMRRDEVEAAWAWVEPILVGWQAVRARPPTLSRRNERSHRRDHPHRARRPYLARRSNTVSNIHPVLEAVTDRITERSSAPAPRT